jgi:L-ascorbate metabolism protein UlaG (beta-lactamase superfamily)
MSIEEFLDLPGNGLFYTGHASIIVKVNNRNYLFDYIEINKPYGDHWVFFPPLTKNIPWTKIDAVFVSHVHQDHYDPLLLRTLDCPIYIIGGRPPFEAVLKNDGIKFIAIPPNELYSIDSEVLVFGVLHHLNGVDASCCIGNSSFSVYHGNDNYTDNSRLAKISKHFSVVDIACVPYAYINWYPQLLENLNKSEKKAESERLVKMYYEYAIDQANTLNATRVIPFGANLTYNDSARSPLNLECKTPLDFEEYVAETRGSLEAKRFKALFEGDVILKEGSELLEIAADNYSKDTYRDAMQEHLLSIASRQVVPDCLALKQSELEDFSVQLHEYTDYDYLVIVRSVACSQGPALAVNTKSGQVDIMMDRDIADLKSSYCLINVLDNSLFVDWVAGKIRLEEIIGSRRFSMFRSPNEYDDKVQFLINTQL